MVNVKSLRDDDPEILVPLPEDGRTPPSLTGYNSDFVRDSSFVILRCSFVEGYCPADVPRPRPGIACSCQIAIQPGAGRFRPRWRRPEVGTGRPARQSDS